jgi:hypothetical protein
MRYAMIYPLLPVAGNIESSCKWKEARKLARLASEKLKEQLGEGSRDAQPKPKPLHNVENNITTHVEVLRGQDKIGGEPKLLTKKTPIPVFIRDYESKLRMDEDTVLQDAESRILKQAAKRLEARHKGVVVNT